MLYYVLCGKYDPDIRIPEDLNKNFTSERTVHINTYYPDTIGNVQCYVDGSEISNIDSLILKFVIFENGL